MATTLVLGYDGSASAHDALDESIDLARLLEQVRVVVTYVHMPPNPRRKYLAPVIEDGQLVGPRHLVEEQAHVILDDACARLRAAGVVVEGLLVWGRAAESLAQVAVERGARFIIVGTGSRWQLTTGSLGSTAAHLMRRSSVPVIAVPAAPNCPRGGKRARIEQTVIGCAAPLAAAAEA